jgi:hypothetical protein
MSDISIRTTKTLLNEDQRWLYGGKVDGPNIDGLLDRSNFDLVTAFPNGFIPSGIALAKVTATDLYIPYVNETSEVQTITFDATGGTYNLKFDGATTPTLTYANAAGDAATIQAALEALPGIDPGDVTVVRGTPAGNVTIFTVTFGGQYAGVNVSQIDATNVVLTGGGSTVTEGTTTAGGTTSPAGEGAGKGLLFATVAYDRDSTGDIAFALCVDAPVIESLLPAGHGVDAAFKADCPHLKFRP